MLTSVSGSGANPEMISSEMRKAGFDYAHPDDVEADVRSRLAAVAGERSTPVHQWPPQQRASLRKLQDYERRVAVVDFRLAEEIFDPVEERIEQELYGRDPMP